MKMKHFLSGKMKQLFNSGPTSGNRKLFISNKLRGYSKKNRSRLGPSVDKSIVPCGEDALNGKNSPYNQHLDGLIVLPEKGFDLKASVQQLESKM